MSHRGAGARPMCTPSDRVQGVPWWGVQRGQRPLARRRPSRREMSEGDRVQTRTTCRMPLHQYAAIAKRAVCFEGVLNAAATKGTSVVDHGSSYEAFAGGKRGRGPLDPSGRSMLGLSNGSYAGKDAMACMSSKRALNTESPARLSCGLSFDSLIRSHVTGEASRFTSRQLDYSTRHSRNRRQAVLHSPAEAAPAGRPTSARPTLAVHFSRHYDAASRGRSRIDPVRRDEDPRFPVRGFTRNPPSRFRLRGTPARMSGSRLASRRHVGGDASTSRSS